MGRVKYLVGFMIAMAVMGTRLVIADEYDKVKILEDQRYSRTGHYSLDLSFSSLPLDAYYKPLALEATGNYQFTDAISWNFLRAGYSLYNYSTGLQGEIRDQTGFVFGRSPIFKTTRYYLASEASINLFYGKLNMLNESIIYHQISVEGGPMFIDFNRKSQLGVDLGMKFQFFLNDRSSVHLKASHMIGFLANAPTNIMILSLGVGFAF
jgi:outer membrane beta-barrel protein